MRSALAVREILKISQEPVSLETPIGEEEDSHLGDFIQWHAGTGRFGSGKWPENHGLSQYPRHGFLLSQNPPLEAAKAAPGWTSLREWILEPQSDLEKVRKYLRENGFFISRENLVLEDGKYYPVLHVRTAAPKQAEKSGTDKQRGCLRLFQKIDAKSCRPK